MMTRLSPAINADFPPLIDIKEHGIAKAKDHLERQAKAAIETELKRLFK
ncbi:MAG: hypothetical protein R3C53_28700 [Pirellulaceae bacterium]